MSAISYLCHIRNPYNLEEEPRLYLMLPNKSIALIKPSELFQSNATVVSYELETLFNYFIPKTETFACEFIDLSHAYRLTVGQPYKGRRGQEPWGIWNILKKEYGDLPSLKTLWSFIYTGLSVPKNAKLDALIANFLDYLEKTWEILRKRLLEKDEWVRYANIEKSVNNIFLKQQLLGIGVDTKVLTKKLDQIDTVSTNSSKILRAKWKLLDPNDEASIKEVLKKAGYAILSKTKDYSSYESLLELYSKTHELPKLLRSYRNSQRDKNILLRLGGISSNRVFPEYKTMGTVTGRILVESPNIQNIGSSNRSIFEPENKRVFLYPDYSQFEPGIMADDSQDENLIDDFNSGDLYSALSRELFGNIADRKYAKIIFLSFCYGMKLNRMIKLAADVSNRPIKSVEQNIKIFFGKYDRLTTWKKKLETELQRTGRIGTRLGCYRYRTSNGKKALTEQEKRWVISQRIQGTAALILKRVILRIKNELPGVDILLPMHDALLLQILKEDLQQTEILVRQIFIEEFMRECPAVKPRVTFESFSKNGEE